MPIRGSDGQVCFVRLDLSLSEIPSLLDRHARYYPGAQGLEERGFKLVNSGFEPGASVEFALSVCKWGRGDRHMGRIRANNTAERIASALKEGCLLARSGSVAEGVERICDLRNLGQSFASKQLRFLEPSRAVILDSVIRTRLGYQETPAGYAEFLEDCRSILVLVQKSNQVERGARFRVCDIEAAVFAKLQGY